MDASCWYSKRKDSFSFFVSRPAWCEGGTQSVRPLVRKKYLYIPYQNKCGCCAIHAPLIFLAKEHPRNPDLCRLSPEGMLLFVRRKIPDAAVPSKTQKSGRGITPLFITSFSGRRGRRRRSFTPLDPVPPRARSMIAKQKMQKKSTSFAYLTISAPRKGVGGSVTTYLSIMCLSMNPPTFLLPNCIASLGSTFCRCAYSGDLLPTAAFLVGPESKGQCHSGDPTRRPAPC